MTRIQVKENLDRLIERLPDDKAELLLDFAAFLSQHPHAPESAALSQDEQELARAEEYWFGLPEEARRACSGKTVAVTANRIVDSDTDLAALRRRVTAQSLDQVILFINAEAEREPILVLRSPRLE